MLQSAAMDLETAHYLLSPGGRTLIESAEELLRERYDAARAILRLQKSAGGSALASAAWSIADGRRRARVKFGDLAPLLYTVPEALEQATGKRASQYHAQRYIEAGFTAVTDLTGGIGGDALAFAAAGLQVTMVERDPVRALFAEENARAARLSHLIEVKVDDADSYDVQTQAIWLDPGRRAGARRLIDPESYTPSLSILRRFADCSAGVKLAPAIEHEVAGAYDASLEFLSESGECKEALLWTGFLRRPEDISAVLLKPEAEHRMSANSAVAVEHLSSLQSTEPNIHGYLYEPDPAVIRAHLVEQLAQELHAAPVDPQIAYLVGARRFATDWASTYEVLDQMPYRPKNVQKALRDRGVGRVIVKKRGVPIEPEDVQRELKLSGPEEMILVLTKIGLQRVVFLCRRVQETGLSAFKCIVP